MNVLLECPTCREQSEHEILKEAGDLLVRCVECGTIHHVPRSKKPRELAIRTIVSHENESKVCTTELFSDEQCTLGDLIVAECENEAFGVEVTGIECGDKRLPRATAEAITTLWTRVIDEVVLKVSVHEQRTTKPLYIRCAGEEDFEIGKVYEIGNIRFRVTNIKLRDGALMRKEGWKAYARKIKRLYAKRL